MTAIVSNSRIIPTHTSQDVKNKITRPDWIALSGGDVVAGGILENRFLGIVKDQKYSPQRLNIENIPGMGSVAVRWIVEGGNSFTVTVDSEKGGKAVRNSK